MDIENILIGLIFLLVGLIGVVWDSRRSAKDKRDRGWDYSIVKIILNSWLLVGAGLLLIILGFINN